MASMFLDGWAAALKGDKKRLEELVKAGNHDINLPHPKSGQTVLHLACLQGNEDIAGMLLMRGATTDKLDSIVGETALHKASVGGHARLVQMLLSVGADKFIKSRNGYTAIDIARKRGHKQVVKLLAEPMLERAKTRGLSTAGTILLRRFDSNIEEESKESSEFAYINELRSLEKKYHMANVRLTSHKQESTMNRVSFENALDVLTSREDEIHRLLEKSKEMEKEVEYHRNKAKKFEKKYDDMHMESLSNNRMEREHRSMERALGKEKEMRAEDKRIANREREALEDKVTKQQNIIATLQQQLVAVEIARDGGPPVSEPTGESELRKEIKEKNLIIKTNADKVRELQSQLAQMIKEKRDLENNFSDLQVKYELAQKKIELAHVD
mmetsp:Transcript_28297/g.45629  ORF Transcript_28297/g.45629 Transcript_28297/m.45629 type:complete len:384 (-) Transcript_28297:1455-2606(-)